MHYILLKILNKEINETDYMEIALDFAKMRHQRCKWKTGFFPERITEQKTSFYLLDRLGNRPMRMYRRTSSLNFETLWSTKASYKFCVCLYHDYTTNFAPMMKHNYELKLIMLLDDDQVMNMALKELSLILRREYLLSLRPIYNPFRFWRASVVKLIKSGQIK